MTYSHTQKGHLDTLFFISMFAFLGLALLLHAQPVIFYLLVLVSAALFTLAFAFSTLTVQDEGEALLVQFGPLRWFRKRIAYADISNVVRSRSHLIDGWGIHYIPLRGWTYNLWGFDCVAIRIGRRVIRVGTDDPDNLVAAIQGKIRNSPPPASDSGRTLGSDPY